MDIPQNYFLASNVSRIAPPNLFTNSLYFLSQYHCYTISTGCIDYRIIYKIFLITFKEIHSNEPAYISDLLKVKHPTRSLRSGSGITLDQPSIYSFKTLGHRSITIAAPKEWNRLPTTIRNSPSLDVFKKQLKTRIFKEAFKKC